MKKLILSALIIAVGVSLFAQPVGFDRLYYSYKGEEGVVALKIPGFVMKLAGSIADLDREEKQLLRSLRSVTVLTIEETDLYPGVNFTEEVNLSRMHGDYQMLLEVHDGDEDVVIAAREKKGKITDLIVVVGGDENVLVHVRGRMNSNLLENLAGVAGVDELNFTAQLSP
ncbi:MAG: DUF4252 domain-containing protein [Bacteroidota bacterium]